MVVGPSVEIVAIEADPLLSNRNFCEMGTHFRVEAVAVHAQIAGRVVEPDDAGKESESGGRHRPSGFW
jgi:hypothetical protein